MIAPDAEMILIGSILRDNAIAAEIAEHVDERDFTSHFTRRAYAACSAGDIDEILLKKKIGDAHGDSIRTCVSMASQQVAVLEHAKRVAHTAVVRRLIDACTNAMVEAKDFDSQNEHDLIDLVTRHQSAILDVSVRRKEDGDFVSNAQGVKIAMAEVERRRDMRKKHGTDYIPGHRTGMNSIDQLLGGLQPKSQVIIGAHTGVGKTAMALNMATGAARNGARVAILSHEMSTMEIHMRKLAAEGRVWASKLEKGTVDNDDARRLAAAIESSARDVLWVTDAPPKTAPKVMQKCLQLKRRHGLDVVFVDYLQLMDGTRPSQQREQVVSEISRSLKQVAMELDICVVALAQLNNTTTRTEEPHLASLRESSAIAQNANAVMLLWAPDDNSDQLCFKVAKNRSGPQGSGLLTFKKSVQLIQEAMR